MLFKSTGYSWGMGNITLSAEAEAWLGIACPIGLKTERREQALNHQWEGRKCGHRGQNSSARPGSRPMTKWGRGQLSCQSATLALDNFLVPSTIKSQACWHFIGKMMSFHWGWKNYPASSPVITGYHVGSSNLIFFSHSAVKCLPSTFLLTHCSNRSSGF